MVHNLLEIDGLRIGFGQFGHLNEVVKGVSFRIAPGKTVALVGESGSGKSVISQAIMGLLPRNGEVIAGRIGFCDPRSPATMVDIAKMPRDGEAIRSLRGGRIGMIFQEPMSSLSPVHRIGDQIVEALLLHTDTAPKDGRAKVAEMLGLVGFKNPDKDYDKYPFELSGGLRQRAMLAMALVCRPALLIADEPTTALDVTIQAQVLKLMKELQRDLGMAILLITHDLGVVANMADEVVVIYHGQVMEAGSAEDIFRRPGHPYLKALMKALPHFDMRDGERLVPIRAARSPAQAPNQAAGTAKGTKPLLTVRNLTKRYGSRSGSLFGSEGGGVLAVDDVSFDIMKGECLGLVGESGCGKTTVSKLLMRAVTASAGHAVFDDGSGEVDLLALKGEALRHFRPRMQMIFQDPVSSLSPRMTVLDILREPLDIHGIGTNAERNAMVTAAMEAVGLDPRFMSRYPHSFSGGQRQRIGIARALALKPSLLVCDEPVSALDVSVQAQVLNLLKDLQAEMGLTYLFVSHNLAVVNYMADRIAVMANGRIVEIAPRHALFARPVHAYTRALLKAVPYADLDRPLDFEMPSLRGASDMSLWPPAFRPGVGTGGGLATLDLGAGHHVLANPAADLKEMVA
ncbi:MAG: ABC transporter ATP-binding protein [Bosea sp. (in: a-proteobacteria)]